MKANSSGVGENPLGPARELERSLPYGNDAPSGATSQASDPLISRQHLRLRFHGATWYARDREALTAEDLECEPIETEKGL